VGLNFKEILLAILRVLLKNTNAHAYFTTQTQTQSGLKLPFFSHNEYNITSFTIIVIAFYITVLIDF